MAALHPAPPQRTARVLLAQELQVQDSPISPFRNLLTPNENISSSAGETVPASSDSSNAEGNQIPRIGQD
jgi:hypothetical protein